MRRFFTYEGVPVIWDGWTGNSFADMPDGPPMACMSDGTWKAVPRSDVLSYATPVTPAELAKRLATWAPKAKLPPETETASVTMLYGPDQARDHHGRWTGDGGGAGGAGSSGKGGAARGAPSDREVDEATKGVEEGLRQGGLSLRPPDDVPKDGFMVSLAPGGGHGAVFDMHSEELGKGAVYQAVRSWTAKEMSAIEHTPNYFLGGWVSDGKVYLDVSERFGPHDRETAIAAVRARDQIAIFDLTTFSEIKTGGTGGVVSTHSVRMAMLGGVDAKQPKCPKDERELLLPPSREYTPKQVADHVVEYIEKYRAEHGLPPMKP